MFHSKCNLILTLLVIICSLVSCSNKNSNPQSKMWVDTKKVVLSGESINLLLPTKFKTSSRYRLKNDVLFLARDSAANTIIQTSLKALEFEDAEIDVLFDSTADYRVLIICNSERIGFSKSDGAFMNSRLNEFHKESEKLNPNIKYTNIGSKYNSTPSLKMIKLKFKVANLEKQEDLYNSVYYLDTPSQSTISTHSK